MAVSPTAVSAGDHIADAGSVLEGLLPCVLCRPELCACIRHPANRVHCDLAVGESSVILLTPPVHP